MTQVGVIQSCADHDPDIDAVYRLQRLLPFTFRPHGVGEALAVPIGTYTPYNAQATVHTTRALWATYLPYTVPGQRGQRHLAVVLCGAALCRSWPPRGFRAATSDAVP